MSLNSKNNLKNTHAITGHRLDTITPKTSVQCSAEVRKINRVLKTIKKENENKNIILNTLCDFVNPNTHRSFTLSAALITSLKGKQRVQKNTRRIISNIENVQKGESSTLQLVSFPAKVSYTPIYEVTNTEVKVRMHHLLTTWHLNIW